MIQNLCTDNSQHVRNSIAQVISKISCHLSPKLIIENLIPIIKTIFNDESLDVKLSIIDSFAIFHQTLGQENVRVHILPLITNSNEKNWRSRLGIVEYLPKLFKEIGFDPLNEELKRFILDFFSDHFFSIRDQSIENFKVIIYN